MNLRSKKKLAARVLNVGENKIHFNVANIAEIKEAITKQDIRDLFEQGIIMIKSNVGKAKIVKRKRRKGPGKTRKTVNQRKRLYVIITRKLRGHIHELRKQGKIKQEDYITIRKKIKMKDFKSKAHLKEHLESMKKIISEDKSKVKSTRRSKK